MLTTFRWITKSLHRHPITCQTVTHRPCRNPCLVVSLILYIHIRFTCIFLLVVMLLIGWQLFVSSSAIPCNSPESVHDCGPFNQEVTYFPWIFTCLARYVRVDAALTCPHPIPNPLHQHMWRPSALTGAASVIFDALCTFFVLLCTIPLAIEPKRTRYQKELDTRNQATRRAMDSQTQCARVN